ncbi:hypothetical protein ABH940_005404 [Streptacidiphilus sp. BW17]|uniref:hypothetical protein n=1 Tax=Streptacidiphilus sp. BW17 TaxID=3156274 RepID=UPI00351413D5
MAIEPVALDDIDAIPDWVPRALPLPVPCGVHFDAIRLPADLGVLVVDRMARACGPVVVNTYAGFWAVLIAPGSAPHWRVHRTRLLRPGTLLALPPLHAPEGRDIHWAVPPTTGWPDPDEIRHTLTAPMSNTLTTRLGA